MPGPGGTSDLEEQDLRQACFIYYHIIWREKPCHTDEEDQPVQLMATGCDVTHTQSTGCPDASTETEERAELRVLGLPVECTWITIIVVITVMVQ